MEGSRFDSLARRIATRTSRRSVIKAGLGSAAGLAAMRAGHAAQAQPSKVLICHQTGDPANPVTLIEVSSNALQSHLDHGDYETSATECCGNGECASGVCSCGDNSQAGVCLGDYYQDFSVDAWDWVDGVTASGGVGVIEGGALPFSRLGGYSSVFPGSGWDVSLDIYLDMSLATGGDIRFDYTSAANGVNCAHVRDFIFSVGTVPGVEGQFAISASNNSPGWPANPDRDPLFIGTTGWYTFLHQFRDAGDGSLGVTLSVNGPGGSSSWFLNAPADIIGSVVGGHRYAWFPHNQFDYLEIDNSQRYTV